MSIRDGIYVAELRGMAQKLQMTVGEVYTPDCSADLGDARCGIDVMALQEEWQCHVGGRRYGIRNQSLAQATGWYDADELTWASGDNTGQTVAVRHWDADSRHA